MSVGGLKAILNGRAASQSAPSRLVLYGSPHVVKEWDEVSEVAGCPRLVQ